MRIFHSQVDDWIWGPPDYDHALSGRDAYWQNIYHHLDESPKPKPEVLTAAQMIAEKHSKRHRGKTEVRVREITSYQVKDILEGILVRYHTTGDEDKEYEVLARPKLFKQSVDIDGRAFTLEAGTEFDPKEMLFRNLMRAMGPRSQPDLIVRAGAGPTHLELTIAIFDPLGSPRYLHELKVNDTADYEDVLRPELPTPLTPGQWTVTVMQAEQARIVVQFEFTVLPMLEENVPEGEDLEWLHSGTPLEEEKEADTNFDLKIKEMFGRESAALKAEAKANAKMRGRELRSWVSALAAKVYDIEKACQVLGKTDELEGSCASQHWSSLAMDHKSTIHGLDETTGKLN